MSIISEQLKAIIQDENTKKVLASVSKKGEVHAVFKKYVEIDDEGNIVVYELLDSSQTGRNLTYCLWFDKKVSLLVDVGDGISYQIKGIPHRDIVTGPKYEEKYKEFLLKNPDNDLAGIWTIIPVEVRDETYEVRLKEERDTYPVIGHMDKDLRHS